MNWDVDWVFFEKSGTFGNYGHTSCIAKKMGFKVANQNYTAPHESDSVSNRFRKTTTVTLSYEGDYVDDGINHSEYLAPIVIRGPDKTD